MLGPRTSDARRGQLQTALFACRHNRTPARVRAKAVEPRCVRFARLERVASVSLSAPRLAVHTGRCPARRSCPAHGQFRHVASRWSARAGSPRRETPADRAAYASTCEHLLGALTPSLQVSTKAVLPRSW